MNQAKNDYQNLVDYLLNQVNQEKDEDIYLTVYLPITQEDKQPKIRKRINQRLKSLILTAFNNSELDFHQKLPQKIVNEVEGKINKIETFYSGIGLFCQFNKQEQLKVTISQFLKSPKEEIFIGQTYDLDQLIWIKNTAAQALILNINQKEGDIYVLSDDQLKKIHHQQNEFLETKIKKLKEYVEQKNIGAAGKMIYGSGTRTAEGEKKLANRLFLNQIISFIQEEKHLKNSFDHLVIFYTYPFNTLIDDLVEISFIKTNFKPFLVTENTQTKKKIKDLTKKNIDQYQKKQKLEALKTARENYHLLAESWKEVIPAARKEKIDTLFVLPVVEKEGHLDNQKNLWLESKKRTKKIKNVAPWLVKKVAESGGKVVLIENNDYLNKVEVAAHLRY
jgi:hypothetical protein